MRALYLWCQILRSNTQNSQNQCDCQSIVLFSFSGLICEARFDTDFKYVSQLCLVFHLFRRLVDMLRENEDVISFLPGTRDRGKIVLGRIVVHDRLKVESSVLPRYFNHSSFASLRRQLNYFCFTRVGKGRQRGATYCNEGVVVMDDILHLKRRSSSVGSSHTVHNLTGHVKRERSTSLSSHSSTEEGHEANTRAFKKTRPSIVSPRSSPLQRQRTKEPPRIALDLTLPTPAAMEHAEISYLRRPLPRTMYKPNNDADILAGCRALLSIARSENMELVW